MNTTEYITQLSDIKSDIKEALTEKGASPSDDFKTYAGEIRNLQTGTGTGSSDGKIQIIPGMKMTHWDASVIDKVDIPNVIRNGVTDVEYMFQNSSVKTLDLSSWDMSNITSLGNIFTECIQLTSIDVSNWDTSNVTFMNFAFYCCSKLTTLDLSSWDTSKCGYFYNLVGNCSKLTTLILGNFDFSQAPEKDYIMIFGYVGCASLTDVSGTVSGIKYDFSLKPCPNLTRESLLVFINGLDTVTTAKTLTLHNNAKSKLTEDDIKIATDKGWTVEYTT